MFGAQVPLRWPFEPSVLLGVTLVTAAYLLAVTRWRDRFPGSAPVPAGRIAAFLLAMATILLALTTPIADLSDNYLFSMHMVEHLLLTMVMPPLLLLGLPGWLIRPLFVRVPALMRVGRVLTNPLVAFGLFNGIFLGYHAPRFYDISLASRQAHAAIHLLFMLAAILTWWPRKMPLKRPKATSGLVRTRPTRSRAGTRTKSGRISHPGRPSRRSGGMTIVRSRCSTMCMLKR
jgi:putative membrane protein